MDYTPVISFAGLIKETGHEHDLETIAESEHDRWCREKFSLGWQYGTAHRGKIGGKDDSVMRERTRLHHDLIPFAQLPKEEQGKDVAPMEKMLELIREYDGLTIYRMED